MPREYVTKLQKSLLHMVTFFGATKPIKNISAEDMRGFVEWMANDKHYIASTIEQHILRVHGTRLWNKLERMCGGRIDIYPHKFRHAMITKALQAGVDIATVSKMAGHSSVGITARNYAHSDDEAKKMVSEVLAKYFGSLT